MMIQDVISKRIEDVEPDLIGLGGLCTDYGFLRDAIGIIRNYDVPIVLGGQIVTNDAEFIFNDLKPDYAIVGEGEDAVVGLCHLMEYGPENLNFEPAITAVKNLWYWEG